MTSRLTIAVLAAALVASLPSAAQHKTPTEAQCRQMASSMMHTIRTTPLTTEVDKRRHPEFLAELEKKLAAIRARGGSECECWAAIVDHVTK